MGLWQQEVVCDLPEGLVLKISKPTILQTLTSNDRMEEIMSTSNNAPNNIQCGKEDIICKAANEALQTLFGRSGVTVGLIFQLHFAIDP